MLKRKREAEEKPYFLEVDMFYYRFIKRENIPSALSGFYTQHVCECLCGFITSSEGYAFFHFFKAQNANHLLQLIQRDFSNSKAIKITLIGANPNSLIMPWKENRISHLMYNGQTGLKALQSIRDVYINNRYREILLAKEIDDYKKLKKFISKASSKINFRSGLFTIDYNQLNKKIMKQSFKASSDDGRVHFDVRSIKDFVSYQNIAKFMQALNELPIKNKVTLSHYHCALGSTIVAEFSGRCRVASYFSPASLHIDSHEKTTNERIGDNKSTDNMLSLNKQKILPFLRFFKTVPTSEPNKEEGYSEDLNISK